mgnify:CR=1 FL=1
MAGTREGGRKAAITNKLKHGADYYSRIGSEGGKNGHTGGFASNRELARIAGAKGGRISKRPNCKRDEDGKIIHTEEYYLKRGIKRDD